MRRPTRSIGFTVSATPASRPSIFMSIWFRVVTLDDATGEIHSAILVEEGRVSRFRGLIDTIAAKGLFCSLYSDRGSHYFHTPEGGRESGQGRPDASRAGAGATGNRAYRRLFARGARTIRASVSHASGPPARGAGARRRDGRRSRQPLYPRGLPAGPQRPLRRRAGGKGQRLRVRRPRRNGATSHACRRSAWSPPTARSPGTGGACRSRPIPPGPFCARQGARAPLPPTARSPCSMGRASWSDGDRMARRIPKPCAPRLEPLWRRRAGLWTGWTRLRLAPPRAQRKPAQKRSIYVLHKPDNLRSSLARYSANLKILSQRDERRNLSGGEAAAVDSPRFQAIAL